MTATPLFLRAAFRRTLDVAFVGRVGCGKGTRKDQPAGDPHRKQTDKEAAKQAVPARPNEPVSRSHLLRRHHHELYFRSKKLPTVSSVWT